MCSSKADSPVFLYMQLNLLAVWDQYHVLSCLSRWQSRLKTPLSQQGATGLNRRAKLIKSHLLLYNNPDSKSPVNMSRPIEQALLSLLPTQNANLPPSLVELASSLLAQSRNKASTLKAEEEVARTYACAHLACDR